MKQMTLIEMDGFLKGKCIPRDLNVNETNAEYLLRKFAEAEAKISALAAENVALKSALNDILQPDAAVLERNHRVRALDAMETPATDAFLAGMAPPNF